MPSSDTNVNPENNLVDPKTLQFRRAIKDHQEAFSMYRRLVVENRQRGQQNAAIQRKLNDEQPWEAAKLRAAGEAWRHNRSTGFMSSLIKRILPAYKQVIDTARVLTQSALDDPSLESKQHSDTFQMEVTKCMRRWKGWNDLWMQVINENVVFGYAALNWSDEYDWKPTFLRTDDALFPDGNPQEASETPMFAVRQNFQIHELADKLIEPEISKSVGWNVDNLVKAINAAQPQNRRKGDYENIRKYEDTIRENTIGRSYSMGVKVVEAAHLFVREANDLVSHYIINTRTGDDLMTHLDRFECMDECLGLFCIDIGNGKLHGSKGAGRVLYNTHVAIEQARNLVADNLYLSGLLLLKTTQKSKQQIAITVTHPVMVVGDGYEVIEHNFQVNSEAFFTLDQHMTKIAEMQVGAFMPGLLNTSNSNPRTASEVNYVASVEQQIKEGILARWWGQCTASIFQMQKRICSEDNIKEALNIYRATKQGMIPRLTGKFLNFVEKIGLKLSGNYVLQQDRNKLNQDAIECCLNMLKQGMSAEQIFEIANIPTGSVTDDAISKTQSMIDMIVLRYKGDPMINQQALAKRDIGTKLGNTIADELVIPAEDNTVQVEATRMQLLEFTSLVQGEEVPISPRDVDDIHMQVIQQKAAELLQTMNPQSMTPETVKIAEGILKHYDDHLNAAMAKGEKKDHLIEQVKFSQMLHDVLAKIEATMKTMPQNANLAPPGAIPAVGAGGAGAAIPTTPAPAAGPPELPAMPVLPTEAMPLSQGPANLTPTVT